MFKFKDLSNTEDELFRPENYQLSVKDFFAKRRTAKRVYLFDLRGAGAVSYTHLTLPTT